MKNILIVDDNPEILMILSEILVKNNEYNILQSQSVYFANKIVHSRDIDLIISDWKLPHQNGLDFINLLKADIKTKNIPVIIISGVQTEAEDLKTALETGAVDYIRKPVNELELVARVKSIFKLNDYQKNIIDLKNQELAVHAMYLLENQERQIFFFNSLKEIIGKLHINKKQTIDYIQQIVNKSHGDLQHSSISKFEHYFNQMYPNFVKHILVKHPNLNPTEIKLCIYLKMNMDSKSIASLMFQTVDSVKTSRSRLRTKLELDRKTNLTTFINSI